MNCCVMIRQNHNNDISNCCCDRFFAVNVAAVIVFVVANVVAVVVGCVDSEANFISFIVNVIFAGNATRFSCWCYFIY